MRIVPGTVLSGVSTWVIGWAFALCIYLKKRFGSNQVVTELVAEPVEILQVSQSGLDVLIDSTDNPSNQSHVDLPTDIRYNIAHSKDSIDEIHQHLVEMKQTIANQLSEMTRTIEKDKVKYKEDKMQIEKKFKEVKEAIEAQRF